MFQSFFERMDSVALPLFGFAVFGVTFVLIVLRTYGVKRPIDYAPIAALALNDPHERSTPEETKP